MEGVRTIKCSDGRWSNEKPSCKGRFFWVIGNWEKFQKKKKNKTKNKTKKKKKKENWFSICFEMAKKSLSPEDRF